MPHDGVQAVTLSPFSAQPTAADFILDVRNLTMTYGEVDVLRGVRLQVASSATFVILGDSGCGKTTLLRILAGLLQPTQGEISLASQDLLPLAPRDRGVVYLDQETLLFEHLNVFENIAFAMRLRKADPALIRTRVDEMLQRMDLIDHAYKKSWRLSGGQKQRVAFARAILASPRLLLLDEPFCSLDGRTRQVMQDLFRQTCEQYQITSLFVTHDVKEALCVGSHFALMDDGRLRTFPDRASFIQDPATGIPQEIQFWREAAN